VCVYFAFNSFLSLGCFLPRESGWGDADIGGTKTNHTHIMLAAGLWW